MFARSNVSSQCAVMSGVSIYIMRIHAACSSLRFRWLDSGPLDGEVKSSNPDSPNADDRPRRRPRRPRRRSGRTSEGEITTFYTTLEKLAFCSVRAFGICHAHNAESGVKRAPVMRNSLDNSKLVVLSRM